MITCKLLLKIKLHFFCALIYAITFLKETVTSANYCLVGFMVKLLYYLPSFTLCILLKYRIV